jgi:hypothetical protein
MRPVEPGLLAGIQQLDGRTFATRPPGPDRTRGQEVRPGERLAEQLISTMGQIDGDPDYDDNWRC